MPRNNGVYEPTSGIPVSNNTVASSAVINALIDDMGDEITNSIARDGTSAAAADIPMGAHKFTDVSNATARNQYPSVAQIQESGVLLLSAVSGTNTVLASLTPAITAYANGLRVLFKPAASNTGTVTLALNGLGNVAVVKAAAVPLSAGDLVSGVWAEAVYDGTNFVLLNPQTSVQLSKVKGASTDRTSTVTLADDTDLVIPLGAGTWDFEAILYWWCPASTTPGLKTAVAFSAAVSAYISEVYSAISAPAGVVITAVGTGISHVPANTLTAYFIRYKGTILAGAAGNLSVQWAQSVSNAAATTLLFGSKLTVRRVG